MEGPWDDERAADPPMLALLQVLLQVLEGPWDDEWAANPPMLALLQVLLQVGTGGAMG